MSGSPETTALEALTAELLGDVGKLHHELKAVAASCSSIRENLQQSEERHGKFIEESVRRCLLDISGAVEHEQDKVAAMTTLTREYQAELHTLARAAIRTEIPKVRQEFYQVATDVLSNANGNIYRERLPRFLVAALLFSMLTFVAGFVLAIRFTAPSPSPVAVSMSEDSQQSTPAQTSAPRR